MVIRFTFTSQVISLKNYNTLILTLYYFYTINQYLTKFKNPFLQTLLRRWPEASGWYVLQVRQELFRKSDLGGWAIKPERHPECR